VSWALLMPFSASMRLSSRETCIGLQVLELREVPISCAVTMRHYHKLRPVALFLRTTSLPYANLSQSQLVNAARKMHFEVERQGL
jgi:hypothetical protein